MSERHAVSKTKCRDKFPSNVIEKSGIYDDM